MLPELQGLLSAGFRKVYGEMADVDRCLRGKGYPSSVPLRSVNLEIQRMDKFLDERIVAEIEMWRPKPWFEVWHERNKFWIWLIGIVLTVAGILAKLLNLF